jgi:hypothetical protein
MTALGFAADAGCYEMLPVSLWFSVSKLSSLYQSVASQETPFVGVNDLTDYLRCGNIISVISC